MCRLLSIPVLPVDETRYLSVTWEMWQSGQWWLPLINGEPYAHKPPLLFWLVALAWRLLGVSDPVSLLVVPLLGLGNLWLLTALVRLLAPNRLRTAWRAPLVLASLLIWQLYCAVTFFDQLMSLGVLASLYALLRHQAGAGRRWFWLAGLAMGWGLLAKGPVLLVYLVPLVLGARYWLPGRWSRAGWLKTAGLALLVGIVVILCWALPAAWYGGAAYAKQIFWSQSAGRMTDSFAHARPFYWYLVLLLPMLLPWPLVWRWRRPVMSDPLLRLALWGLLPQLLIFSLFSGKQPHYLLPCMPFVALGLSQLLPKRLPRNWGLLVLLGLLALAFAVLPELMTRLWHQASVAPAWRALALLPLVLLAWLWHRPGFIATAVALPLCLGAALLAMGSGLQRHYDLTPMARVVVAAQQAGQPVAHLGKYHDQFRYLGRGEQPLTVLDPPQVAAWFADHPDGLLVLDRKRLTADWLAAARFHQPYRTRHYLLLDRAGWQRLFP
ncbi:glycosyltransferase family 39 protein [Pseudaeromonas sp. ZJS20]|uniref:ArnT family glycosyltransferase n=1 Tax=Pseudaeromonas aegiceratis TaxID=3153928 RepID=UPI00390C7E42